MRTGYWEVRVEGILKEKGDWPGELLQNRGKRIPGTNLEPHVRC